MENTPFKQLLAGLLNSKADKQPTHVKAPKQVKKPKANPQKGKKVS
jgi:hypothetical protein